MNEERVGGLALYGFIGLILFIGALVAGGTFRTELSYVQPGAENVAADERPEQTFTSRHWIWGLIQGKQPDLQSSLDVFVHPDPEMTRMTIVTKHSVTDGLLTGLTLGIYT